ncbi:uncharacterized protein LOC144750575 [Ciona intestinalis]
MATPNVVELNEEVKRSVVIQLKGNVEHISVSTFMELFAPGGPLEAVSNDVEGVITESFKDVAFLLTLKLESAHKVERIIHHFNTAEVNFTSANGNNMVVTAHLPKPPLEVVTLHPVPCYVAAHKISNLLEKYKWGQVHSMEFGYHRNYQHIKNGWLNISFQKLNINNLPKVIKICGKWATVTRPGESHLPLCRFCKERGHVQTRCPKKGHCNFCQTEGHITKNCRSKPVAIGRREQPWVTIAPKPRSRPTPQDTQLEMSNKFDILGNEEPHIDLANMEVFPSLAESTSQATRTPKPQRKKKQRTPRGKEASNPKNDNQAEPATIAIKNDPQNTPLSSPASTDVSRNETPDMSMNPTAQNTTEENIEIIEQYHRDLIANPSPTYHNMYSMGIPPNELYPDPPMIRRSPENLQMLFKTTSTPTKKKRKVITPD